MKIIGNLQGYEKYIITETEKVDNSNIHRSWQGKVRGKEKKQASSKIKKCNLLALLNPSLAGLYDWEIGKAE